MFKLYLKQALVGNPLGQLGRRVRWVLQTPQRLRHPELWDMYLEDRRTHLALEALIEDGDCCVDVGAHIGSMLADMVRLSPSGTHIAFEPVPHKATWLRKKFKMVSVVEAATSAEPGTATFYDDVDQPGFSGLIRPAEGTRTRSFPVDLVTLDATLAAAERVDFIKIDVEGAELPTLQGALDVLADHRPKVLFECGPGSNLQSFGYKRADLFDHFVGQGYDIYSMVDFVYGRESMTRESFEKAGTYPYRGFNFVALPADYVVHRLA
jgi:FkbM family methyltransferase